MEMGVRVCFNREKKEELKVRKGRGKIKKRVQREREIIGCVGVR